MRALSLYGGRSICACHGRDEERHALLLERVLPGEALSTVASGAERVAIGARVIAGLPVPVQGEAHDLPAYGDWVRRAFARARREGSGGPAMLRLIDAAEALLREIDTPERPRMLLHGDLHHFNILRNHHGGWTAIDPKGAIGPRCLEVGRFILNEAQMPNPADLDLITATFGEALGESRRTIAACALIDRVLSTCWSLEERGAPEQVTAAIQHGEALLRYVERK